MYIWMVADASSIHTARIARMLCERGIRVAVVSGNKNRNPEIPKEAEILSIPKPVISLPKIRGLSIIYRMRKLWKQCQPDIVHVHYIATEAWYCAVARIYPLVVTCWGSDIHSLGQKNEGGLSRWRVAYVLRKADLVTADSEEILMQAKSVCRRIKANAIWRIGVDLKQFRPNINTREIRRMLGVNDNQQIVLSPRAMRPLMNHDLVLEAFAMLASKYPQSLLVFKNYGIHFPGAIEYRDQLKKRAAELKLHDRVIFMNDIPYQKMPELYNAASVVVNIPQRDGMAMTLLEAMGCGKPCIIGDLAAYRELISGDSQAGTVVKIDALSIFRAMDSIFCNESTSRQMGIAARNLALAIGGQNQEAQRLINEYKILLDKG